jgi:hypothetical protein
MKGHGRWLASVFSGPVLFTGVGGAQAPYYAAKTITVIEGNSPGGVADLRVRQGSPQFASSIYFINVVVFGLGWRKE